MFDVGEVGEALSEDDNVLIDNGRLGAAEFTAVCVSGSRSACVSTLVPVKVLASVFVVVES